MRGLIHFDQGTILYNERSFKEAAREFSLAAEAVPTLWRYHYCIGQSLMALQEFTPAIRFLKRAKKVAPNVAIIDSTLLKCIELEAVTSKSRRLVHLSHSFFSLCPLLTVSSCE